MKIPEKAPDWTQIALDSLNFTKELRETVRKANKDYLYCDEFKYIVPETMKPEHAWTHLKVIRIVNMRTLKI